MPANESLIRLYLDADVDVKLAANLREAGYDCVSAREVDNAALILLEKRILARICQISLDAD